MNVFEVFLPQLLLYPNPTDPLNGEAAALLMREPEAYHLKVKGALSQVLKHLGGGTSAHCAWGIERQIRNSQLTSCCAHCI